MTAALPKPKHPWKAHKEPAIKQARRRTPRSGEPLTLEGRVRKKLQMGLSLKMGCVFTYAEMLEVLKAVPLAWLKKECE